MTVSLYSGTPGSGKSLHVTRIILMHLSAKRSVISNYPIKFTKREIKRGFEDRFFYVDMEHMTVENLMKFAKVQGYMESRKEGQCLVVIDEAGGRFNSESDKGKKQELKNYFSDDNEVKIKEYGRDDRMKWKKFFSQHRKYGFDFILIAQEDLMLDRQIRSMIEKHYVHRKASNLYWWFALLPVKLFVCIEYYYQLKMRTDAQFFIYTKNIGNRYDSMKLFDEFNVDLDISGIDARAIFNS